LAKLPNASLKRLRPECRGWDVTTRHVNAIAGRLSLRPPQRRSLEILDRITEIAPPKKGLDL
jgi:hypothetical protein